MMKVRQTLLFLTIFAVMGSTLAFAWEEKTPSIKVGTFKQEISTVYTQTDGLPSTDVRCLTVASDGSVYAGTSKGLAVFSDETWNRVSDTPDAPVLALKTGRRAVLAAFETKLYLILNDSVRPIADLPQDSINDMAVFNRQVYIAANSGLYRTNEGQFDLDNSLVKLLGSTKTVHAVAINRNGDIAAAGEAGLFLKKESGSWKAIYPQSKDGRSWAPRDVKGVAFDRQNRLWFASPQGVGCYDKEWKLYTGAEGLPYNDITCVVPGEDGVVWLGTTIGAIRYDGKDWAYRQGRRWLPNDTVNDIAVTQEGHAWFATPDGVGLIERRPMTLAEKAEFYENEVEKYIKRTDYGYLSEVHLRKPGDKSEIVYSDSDNDGLWTSMYGAGECFAYAATKDPKAKKRAKQAFEALRFLSIAPVNGEVKQQPGYVARTVLPTSEPDPNKRGGHTLEGQKRSRDSGDARWKVYVPRWPLTKDGKYWYKTDTSSDELDGHFFFYALYHDLVADTPQEKERVREVVRGIADHLVRNDFCLIDHDGTPTRWAIFGPSALNNDFGWFAERGLNSLSILSYLAVAEHVTDDPKYGEAAKMLIDKHGYGINAMITKLQRGPGSGNQSDDEMAFMGYYNLIKYTKDDALRKEMTYSFFKYWINEFQEINPFFNFAYAACGQGIEFTDPWGTYSMNPYDGWLEDSVETLKGFPLDRLDWALRNSHRLDIIRLGRHAGSDPTSRGGRARGYRVNGKVLPIQERHFNHWNTDPWTLDTGGGGQTLANGTVYLLPYYMGLYHGYIK